MGGIGSSGAELLGVPDRGVITLAPPAEAHGSRQAAAPRVVARRRTLPGSRAVVGGLLVTASAVGLFAAYGASQEQPAEHYVVMADEVPVGHIFTSADFEVVAIDLPGAQRAVSFTDQDMLVGNIAMARLREGQLVQSGDVADRTSSRGEAQISVPVEPAHAMNGQDLAGELVDVIVTYTQGGTPVTRTVASGVMVVQVLGGDRDLGGSGQLTVVLNVDPDHLESIAGAATAGKITLARTTGLAR